MIDMEGKDYILITKFSYLKTPKYTWVFKNRFGGSFSNSGNQKSLKACAKHAFEMKGKTDWPVIVETIMGFTESDDAILSQYETTLDKLIAGEK